MPIGSAPPGPPFPKWGNSYASLCIGHGGTETSWSSRPAERQSLRHGKHWNVSSLCQVLVSHAWPIMSPLGADSLPSLLSVTAPRAERSGQARQTEHMKKPSWSTCSTQLSPVLGTLCSHCGCAVEQQSLAESFKVSGTSKWWPECWRD